MNNERDVAGSEERFRSIRAGSRVTIATRLGGQVSGRAVMRGPFGWLLNCGGPHGRPAIADSTNVVVARRPRVDDFTRGARVLNGGA